MMNRSNTLAVALCAAAAATLPTAALGQDFLGGLARRAAEAAAQRAVQSAVGAVVNRQTPAPEATAPAAPQTASAAGAATASALPADLPAPRPINYSTSLRRPGQLEFSPEDQAGRARFDEFGKVRCSDCEGGYAFETWVRHAIPSLWGPHVLENRLGGMAVGEAIRWTGGRGAQYALTVTSEHAIGPWPCKQLRWTAVRGSEAAERPGLICKATGSDNWTEVL